MIRLEDISYGYHPGELVLSNVSADFPPGAMSAVTGRSGCGKSTLLYLIGLLLTPVSGHLLLLGHEPTHLSDALRSRLRGSSIGFVFQDAALDPTRTVLDNVIEGAAYVRVDREATRHRAVGLLNACGVELAADRRPGEVSGGQAQRVALCRALVMDPEIILADEPTGNLDADTKADVIGILQGLTKRGKTVVVATHDAAVVKASDRVLKL